MYKNDFVLLIYGPQADSVPSGAFAYYDLFSWKGVLQYLLDISLIVFFPFIMLPLVGIRFLQNDFTIGDIPWQWQQVDQNYVFVYGMHIQLVALWFEFLFLATYVGIIGIPIFILFLLIRND